MPTRMADYGIDPEEAAAVIRQRFESRAAIFGEHGDIDGSAAAAAIVRPLS